MENRRAFIQKVAVAAVAATLPVPAAFAAEQEKRRIGKKIKLEKGYTILFQGDSVTDCGRSRDADADLMSKIGPGYPRWVVTRLVTEYPDYQFTFVNRGISGNKVYQLQDRWKEDCLDIKPDVLSILIGVNDYWHTLSSGYKGTPETYETSYRELLTETKKRLPKVKLIICEPFGLVGVGAVTEQWRTALPKYQAIAQKLAKEFGATFIPMQTIFNEAEKEGLKYGIPSNCWTDDGVHPSSAGHILMANAILEVFK